MKMFFCMSVMLISVSQIYAQEAAIPPVYRSESQIQFLCKKAQEQEQIPMVKLQLLNNRTISAPVTTVMKLKKRAKEDVINRGIKSFLTKKEMDGLTIETYDDIMRIRATPVQKEVIENYTVWLTGDDVQEYEDCENDIFIFGQWIHYLLCYIFLFTIFFEILAVILVAYALLAENADVMIYLVPGTFLLLIALAGQWLLHSIGLALVSFISFIFVMVIVITGIMALTYLIEDKMRQREEEEAKL